MVELNQLRVARKSFSKSVFCSSKIAVFFEVIKSVAVNYVFHYFGARTKEGNGSVVLDVVFWAAFMYRHYVCCFQWLGSRPLERYFLKRTSKQDEMILEHDVTTRSGIPSGPLAL